MARIQATGGGSIAIGQHAAASGSHSIAVGFSTTSAGPMLSVPNPPVVLETCRNCGALMNTGSPEAVATHLLWHERIDVLLKMLDPARAQMWLEAREELQDLYQTLG